MSEFLNQDETENFEYFQMGPMQHKLEEILELRRVEAEPILGSTAMSAVIEKPQV